jgi:hypothetical protein
MWIAITVIVVSGMALYVLNEWRKSSQALQSRRVVLEERQQTPEAPAEKPEPISALLVIMAQSESEPWATDDSLKAFYEAREKLGSWQPVAGRAIANALKGEKWDALS